MSNSIFIRNVREDDIEEVFLHSNQDFVRKYSINKEKISWTDHIIWFNNIIVDANSIFYVVTDDRNKHLGQIRYRIEDDTAVVSISLSELIRGKGYSETLLYDSMNRLFTEKNELKSVVAYISEKNIPSLKLFEKAGFSYCTSHEEFLKYIFCREVYNNENR